MFFSFYNIMILNNGLQKKIFIIFTILIFLVINIYKLMKLENFDNKTEELKLGCVLTAVNTNPEYLDFIPLFIKSWTKFYPDVEIKIILIGEKIPLEYKKYEKYIILYKPPSSKISTAFISQFIRLLYPSLLKYNNGIMITDIDSIPLNNKYFTHNLKGVSNNTWLNYRNWKDRNQIAMCWQIATPKIWKEVFNINNILDIDSTLIEVYSKINYQDGSTDKNWFTDQLFLYEKVMLWNKKTNNYRFLHDKNTGYNRLDRINFKNIDKKIELNLKKGLYSDYHMLRPPKNMKLLIIK